MAEERKRMKPLQIAFLLLMLVILPAGSWLYLRGGYQHRKAALEELKDLGAVGDFSMTDQNGLLFNAADLKKRVTVAAFLPGDPGRQEQWVQQLSRLHEQFDDRNDVCFLLFADSTQLVDGQAFLQTNNMTDSLQWILLIGQEDDLKQLADAAFHLPQTEDGRADHRYLTLIDTEGTVRRHYDLQDDQEMGRLVEHITIVMPKLPDPDIVFKREKEK